MTSKSDNIASQAFVLPGSAYGYTGTPVDAIQSSDNTLVVSAFDQSGSTRPYSAAMIQCIKNIVKACGRSPVADRLIYRQVHFDDAISEFHGYKELSNCNESDYDNCWQGGGCTNLYGACENILDSVTHYAEQQAAKRYTVNALAFIITDAAHYYPQDTRPPTFTMEKVRDAHLRALKCEALESIMTILIGITGGDKRVEDELRKFSDFCQFTQFEFIENTDDKTLAKLAQFISASVSSQGQSCGTGGPSQSLTF